LEDREENLDIKSPTDGVVISGDPKKLEGARLTMGQTLAEVGPMDENMFELEIPDVDVRHVSTGDPVRIKLDSLPGETLTGKLALIHPRAEQRGDRNVFIGDVEIEKEEDLQLRPGMKGKAKIIGPKRALGWNLFHKAWDQLLFRLGW
ncbi:HlyD family secretion protein, partial [Planctomycetota bacterium]